MSRIEDVSRWPSAIVAARIKAHIVIIEAIAPAMGVRRGDGADDEVAVAISAVAYSGTRVSTPHPTGPRDLRRRVR